MADDDTKATFERKYHLTLDALNALEREWQNYAEHLMRCLAKVCIVAQESDPTLAESFDQLNQVLAQSDDKTHHCEHLVAVEAMLARSAHDYTQRLTAIKQAYHHVLAIWKYLALPLPLADTLKRLERELKSLTELHQAHEFFSQLDQLAQQIVQALTQGELVVAAPKHALAVVKQWLQWGQVQSATQLPPIFNESLARILQHIGVTRAQYQHAEQLIEQVEQGITLEKLPQFVRQLSQLVTAIAQEDDSQLAQVITQLRQQTDDSRLFLDDLSQFMQRHADTTATLDEKVNARITVIKAELKAKPSAYSAAIEAALLAIVETVQQWQANTAQLVQTANSQIRPLARQLTASERLVDNLSAHIAQKRFGLQRDALTRLHNREAYEDTLNRECTRAQRYQHPLSCMVIDIDHFKRINDNFGHDSGDRAIAGCATLIASNVRETDFVARYGGEEFVVLLPEVAMAAAQTSAEKLRSLIEQAPFRFQEQEVRITVSIGIAAFQQGQTPDQLFKSADTALFAAKQAGRNCVRCAQ